MSATYESVDGYLELPYRHQGLTKLAVVCGLVAIASLIRNPFLIGVAGLSLLAAVGFPRLVSYRSGRLRADSAGVHMGEALVAPAPELGGGITSVADHETYVWLFRPSGRFALRIRMKSPAEGRQLLSALELAPHQRTARVLLKAGPLTRWAWLIPAVLGAGFVPVAIVFATLEVPMFVGILLLAFGLSFPFAFQLLGAKRIEIGADGFAVNRMGFRRFVAYRQVEQVQEWKPHRRRSREYPPRGVTVVLRDGSKVRLRTVEARQVSGSGDEAEPDFVAKAIREGMQARAVPTPTAALVRGNQPAAEWLESLRSMGKHEAEYRSRVVDADELWRALESASTPPAVRLAAAIALSVRANEGDRARLARAASSSASLDFRAAVGAVLAGKDAAVLRALG